MNTKNWSKNRKSVVLLCDSMNLGGAELYQLQILKKLEELNIPTFLITQYRGILFPDYKKHTLGQVITPFPFLRKPSSWIHLFLFKRRVKRFLKKIPGKKIILVGDLYPLWAALKLKSNDIEVYSIWQGQYVFRDDHCVRKWKKYGADLADKLISSEPVAIHANSLNLLNKEVMALNPQVNLERFNPKKYDRNKIRKDLGWGYNEKIAICVGQISERKGQPWLAKEYLRLEKLYKDWKLIIVGPHTKEDTAFWDSLLKQDVNWRLKLLGIRYDIPELLAAADLAIFPGTCDESFGLAVVEACLMNIPLLALDGGAIPATLGENYPGLFKREQKNELINKWFHMQDQDLEFLKNSLPRERVVGILSPKKWEKKLVELVEG